MVSPFTNFQLTWLLGFLAFRFDNFLIYLIWHACFFEAVLFTVFESKHIFAIPTLQSHLILARSIGASRSISSGICTAGSTCWTIATTGTSITRSAIRSGLISVVRRSEYIQHEKLIITDVSYSMHYWLKHNCSSVKGKNLLRISDIISITMY